MADLVEACSDSLTADPTAKEDSWTRKVRYLQKLTEESPEVALVSCADKVHNARAILSDYLRLGEDLWTRFNPAAGRAGTLWYYRRLVEVLTDRLDGGSTGATSLAGELGRVVEAIFLAVRSVVGGVLVAEGEDEGRRCQAEALAHLALRGAEG